MPVYRTNGRAETGGQTIGVLCLDEYLPFAPGDVNNASSYGFPVKYRLVPGMLSAKVVANDLDFLPALLDAARQLEREGVRGIITNCGYMLQFQRELSNAVSVPVVASSLALLPVVASSLAPDQPIGIMAAAAPPMSEEFIRNAGFDVPNPLAIYGLQDAPGILQMLQACGVGDEDGSARAGLMTLDTDQVAADMVEVAQTLVAENPNTGAIIFECSDFPPYAAAVQRATGLPVFDTITAAQLLFDVTHPQRYSGHL